MSGVILRRTSLRIANVTRHVNHSPSLNTDVFGCSRPSLEALGKIGCLEALALKERLCNQKSHLGIVGVLAFFPQRGRHHFPEALRIPSESFDGFDAVLRAFEETWYLGHELRLSAYHDKAMAWLAGEGNTWSAKISVLLAFGERRGHHRLNTGRDYNLLSELAHPTATAAQNSLTVCLVRRGLAEANAELTKARENNPERIRYALYRLGWLVLDGDPQFIPIPVAQGTMPLTETFLNTYEHVEPGT